MKAMILAGGMSTRLYPLTKAVPKPLVPLLGEPNAAHMIRYLAAYGFDEIAINVHYLADQIVAALGDGSKYGVRLEYLHEHDLTGSAGAVKQLQSFFGDAPFVVVGCDEVTNLPLDQLLQFHEAKNALATIGLVECEEVDQYGVVITDEQSRIVDFQEKPPKGTERSKLANTGIYAFHPRIFDFMPPAGEFYDFGKQLFPELQRRGEAFYGYHARGAYWCDIGTPGEYRRATRDALEGVFALPGTQTGEGKWVASDASVAADARIAGPCVVGAGVRVGSGAVIEGSILWPGASVGAGAVLKNCIVGLGYAVPDHARLEDAIVANEPA